MKYSYQKNILKEKQILLYLKYIENNIFAMNVILL